MHPACFPGEGCSRSTMFTQLVQTPIHRLTPEALPLWFCGRTSRDVWSCARTDWKHRRMCACCRPGVGLARRRAARDQWSTAASLGGLRVGGLHRACCLRSRRPVSSCLRCVPPTRHAHVVRALFVRTIFEAGVLHSSPRLRCARSRAGEERSLLVRATLCMRFEWGQRSSWLAMSRLACLFCNALRSRRYDLCSNLGCYG